MNFREWLIITGSIAVGLIILDGIRRVWLAHRKSNELNFGLEDIRWDDDFQSELPNGGSRKVTYKKFEQSNQSETEKTKKTFSLHSSDILSNEENQSISIEPESIDNSQPDLFSNSLTPDTQPDISDLNIQSDIIATPYTTHDNAHNITLNKDNMQHDIILNNNDIPTFNDASNPHNVYEQEIKTDNIKITDNVEATDNIQTAQNIETPSNSKILQDASNKTDDTQNTVKKEPKIETIQIDTTSKSMPDLLVFNLIATRGSYFTGKDVFSQMKLHGFHFGSMKVFHYSSPNDKSKILFTAVNGVEPGTFSLDTIETDKLNILSFFMDLSSLAGEDHMLVFNKMVEVVFNISDALGGVIKDDQLNMLTQQMLEYYRDRISNSIRKKKIHASTVKNP